MSLNINKWDVLVLNKNWLVLGTTTIRNAIKSLFSTPDGNNMAARAFLINYELIEENTWNFENPIEIRPVDLDEWLNQEIRPFDDYISTAKRRIRVPSVIQAQNCDKTHLRKVSLSTKNILERDGYTCQYTGKKLSRHELNIDHVISKDEWRRKNLPGTPDCWTNMVACDKKLNSIKSNKTLEEAGLRLIRQPKEPLPLPASSLIKEIRNKDWEIFLHKN